MTLPSTPPTSHSRSGRPSVAHAHREPAAGRARRPPRHRPAAPGGADRARPAPRRPGPADRPADHRRHRRPGRTGREHAPCSTPTTCCWATSASATAARSRVSPAAGDRAARRVTLTGPVGGRRRGLPGDAAARPARQGGHRRGRRLAAAAGRAARRLGPRPGRGGPPQPRQHRRVRLDQHPAHRAVTVEPADGALVTMDTVVGWEHGTATHGPAGRVAARTAGPPP